jgi:hypothetical protein
MRSGGANEAGAITLTPAPEWTAGNFNKPDISKPYSATMRSGKRAQRGFYPGGIPSAK